MLASKNARTTYRLESWFTSWLQPWIFLRIEDTVNGDPPLPEIVPPPRGLMRKQRPIWVWIGLALLLGAMIALILVGLISD